MSFITTTYDGREFTVPATGRDENLNSMLTEIPDDAHAMAFLMQDGDLAVPCGRYGGSTASCAPAALALAKIMQYHSGEPMTYYQLDSDMGLVVNSSDDVGPMIREYGELVGVDPDDFYGLDDDEDDESEDE